MCMNVCVRVYTCVCVYVWHYKPVAQTMEKIILNCKVLNKQCQQYNIQHYFTSN